MSVAEPLPVTVIGGYLGAGKTTLVNHLLRHANGLRLAVLVNDFGELAIDEDLIEAENDTLISIAGGCVCCSFGSSLSGALLDLAKMDPKPDHLLIESSGVAIPGAIVGSVSLLEGFRVEGVVILADAETLLRGAANKYMGDTVTRQIDDASIIILNKTDLVNAASLAKTRHWLGQRNSGLRIIEASHGVVSPAVVLGGFPVDAVVSGLHHDTANLEMVTLNLQGPTDAEELAKCLAGNKLGIIRAKGFVTSLTGQKTVIQVVGSRWTTSIGPANATDSIVCLGFKGVMAREDLKRIENFGQDGRCPS